MNEVQSFKPVASNPLLRISKSNRIISPEQLNYQPVQPPDLENIAEAMDHFEPSA
jgi:hypothetical protein